jgi:DNA repair protein RadC
MPLPLLPLTPPPIHTVTERPRERLLRTGTVTLGDKELVALLLGTGVRERPAVEVAADLLRRTGGIIGTARASARELAQISGIGSAGAARISAAFELGRRVVDLVHHRLSLERPDDVYRVLAPRFTGMSQELFLAAGVDIRNGLLDVVEVARGSVASVEVHPREVFRPLVRMAAAGAVLVHNHPSGDPTPSREDVELTRRMRQVGRVLGIPIVDHVIIGDRQFCSICEWLGTAIDRD